MDINKNIGDDLEEVWSLSVCIIGRFRREKKLYNYNNKNNKTKSGWSLDE